MVQENSGKMKLDLSQWIDSVRDYVEPVTSVPRKIWIRPMLSMEDLTETKAVLKYKRVDQKIRPIPSQIPAHMKAQRRFPEDPLHNLPSIPYHPPKFQPTIKFTAERMKSLEIDNNTDLWLEEKKLLKHVLVTNERSIAFDENERGTFRSDYFSDYKMPVVDHLPWQEKNIPLPAGYRDEIIGLLKEKIQAGVYEGAQSSY